MCVLCVKLIGMERGGGVDGKTLGAGVGLGKVGTDSRARQMPFVAATTRPVLDYPRDAVDEILDFTIPEDATPKRGPVCRYCGGSGHTEAECRKANGWCFGCGSPDHLVARCRVNRCAYCHRLGHGKARCHRRRGTCFRCGSLHHRVALCAQARRLWSASVRSPPASLLSPPASLLSTPASLLSTPASRLSH